MVAQLFVSVCSKMAHLYISVYKQPEEIFYHIIVQTIPL